MADAKSKSLLPPVVVAASNEKGANGDGALNPALTLRKGKSTARNLGVNGGEQPPQTHRSGDDGASLPRTASLGRGGSRSDLQGLSKQNRRVGASARELRPLVRKRTKLTLTAAGKKARLRGSHRGEDETNPTPASAHDDEEDEDEKGRGKGKIAVVDKATQELRKQLEERNFQAHLIQLGSSYRVAFSENFIRAASQFDFQVSVFITRKRPAAKMANIEEDEEFGKMNKPDAKVVFLGNLPQLDYDPQSVKDDEPLNQESIVDHDYFYGDCCFAFDSVYPTMVSKPLDWTGVVLAKRAESKPVTLYPSVLFYGKLAVLSDKKKAVKKKDAIKASEEIQEKMLSATTWEPGLGLRSIRRLLRAKLRYFDRDGSGTIDLEEFKTAMENLGLFLTETRLQKLFQACDLDRSGTVELEELPLALHINDQLRTRTRMTPRDAFELFDYDGSGSINEQEFFEVVSVLPVASMSREKAGKVFARHDVDHSGEIEYEEFREIWLSSLCDINRELTARIKEAQAEEVRLLRAGDQVCAADRGLAERAAGTEGTRSPPELVEGDQEKAKAKSAAAAPGTSETPGPDVAALESEVAKLERSHARQLQKELRRSRAGRIKLLRELVLKEELDEAAEFEAARQKAYEDAHALRLETDSKKRQEKLQRRREEIAAKVAISKAERELRRQKQLEASQRRRAEEREKALRAQLNKEIRYREEKERADRRTERELRLQQEKEARARRGDDRLDLPNQGLRAVPPALFRGHEAQNRLGHLVSIDLSHNKLESLPPQGLFFWCGAMRKLDVSNNRLTSLPSEIEALESVEIFTAVHNRLREIPVALGSLPKLISINLAENVIEEVPEELGALKEARSLLLYKNAIKRLPASLGRLSTLQKLDVSLNALRELPDEICELANLRTLDASWNHLQKLPTTLGNMASLQTLILSGNDLRRLPDSLHELHALQVLQLGRNDLIEVPATIKGLVSLLRLDVSRNRVVRIPSELGRLRALQHLDISGNLVRTLPPELGRLRYLVIFEAQSNLIERIPEEMGAMSSLEELNLCHNKLSGRLPTAIGALRQLRKLNFAENALETLPASMGALVHLKELNLNGNELTILPGTVACWNLEKLLLSRNRIDDLPLTFGNLCDSLELLDLSSNVLEFVPEEITSLKALRHLDLHHNRLQAVPPAIAKLIPQLETFRVTHNPLGELPPKFANEVTAGAPRSALLWSGYSDGQVADWAVDVQDVIGACRACIDLGRALAPNSDPDRQSFWEFSTTVKESLMAEGKWREQLMPHVNSFFFRAKALGEVPRLDAVKGSEVSSRAETIAKREEERNRIAAEAKESHEERELRMREVYAVSRNDFLQTETKLKRNAARLRRERDLRRKKEMEATRPIYERQEQTYIETKRRREEERKAQLSEWLTHFHEKHEDFIQEIIASEAAGGVAGGPDAPQCD